MSHSLVRLQVHLVFSTKHREPLIPGPHGKFSWQNGYGAFAVSETNVDVVRKYILKQREHHKKKTYQAEYKTLLAQNGIALEQPHLWD